MLMGSWMSPPGRNANCALSSTLCLTRREDSLSAMILFRRRDITGPTDMGLRSAVLITSPSDLRRPMVIPYFSKCGMSFDSRQRLSMRRRSCLVRLGSLVIIYVFVREVLLEGPVLCLHENLVCCALLGSLS